MVKIHEIGDYSTAKGDVLKLYIVEVPTYVDDHEEVVSASTSYCMESKRGVNRLFVPDWLAFAHMVNAWAGQVILDIHDDPAIELGLCVPVGMECPGCGCRVLDSLDWVDDDTVECDPCGEQYHPGKN